MSEPARSDEGAPHTNEAALLTEIARLYAALIHVVAAIDDPQLKAEIAELIWPHKPIPHRRNRPMSTVSPYRKLVAQILGSVVVLLSALSAAGADAGDLWAQFIVAVAAVIAVFMVSNTGSHPAAKFGAAVLGALAAYIAYGLQADVVNPWGWQEAEGGGLVKVLGVAVLAAAITYLTPNEPTVQA